MVARVVMEEGRAVGVCYVKDGELHTVGSEEVVLAAGSIGTPTILQRSGIGEASILRRAGVTPRVALPVGSNLQDHPWSWCCTPPEVGPQRSMTPRRSPIWPDG